jgi:F0F1-type ATP synthase assembly protein I
MIMSKDRPQSNSGNGDSLMDHYAKHRLNVFMQVTALTILVIGIIGGIGYALDTVLETTPLGTIISLVLAYPILQFILFKKFRRFGKK